MRTGKTIALLVVSHAIACLASATVGFQVFASNETNLVSVALERDKAWSSLKQRPSETRQAFLNYAHELHTTPVQKFTPELQVHEILAWAVTAKFSERGADRDQFLEQAQGLCFNLELDDCSKEGLSELVDEFVLEEPR